MLTVEKPFAAAERDGRKGEPPSTACRERLLMNRKHEEDDGEGGRQRHDQAHVCVPVSMAVTIEGERQGEVSPVQGNG